ncbi:MAG: NUDIX domain-containing protein [Ignavibacteria bacterium]
MSVIVSKIVEVFVYRMNEGKREYLLLKRSEDEIHPGIWSVCGGTLEQGEKAYQAAAREMKEETGLTPLKLFKADTVNIFYEDIDDRVHIVPVFLAEADKGTVTLSDEHTDFIWCDLDGAKKLLHWISWRENIEFLDRCLNEEDYFKTLKQIT